MPKLLLFWWFTWTSLSENEECPEYINKLIIEKGECIDNCSKDYIYKYEYKKICYDNFIILKKL